ncbi:MAG TPA: tetraacyldisaccharide 4'-kinase [Pirellulaceae bacterium]|nr:tetraacyldisaccharide 4'-kinase [Pirellulaceae bacterium]
MQSNRSSRHLIDRSLLCGQRPGLSAWLLRCALSCCEPIYHTGVALRNISFDQGWRRPASVACPVISVGNLTTGGTGKTPLVHWLVRTLVDRQLSVGVISRGYRALADGMNDEAKEFVIEFPQVMHLQNPRRILAARELVDRHRVQAIILDDGFQHRQFARDLDVVTLDALEPWGFGHVLPRGLLRESVRGLRRADWIVITRSNLVSAESLARVVDQASRYAGHKRIAIAEVVPRRWLAADMTAWPLESIVGRPEIAFCGLGQPTAFLETLQHLELDIREWNAFPDHYHFNPADIERLCERARECGVHDLVCTVKDLVKLDRRWFDPINIWGLQIEHRFVDGQELLMQQIEAVTRSEDR